MQCPNEIACALTLANEYVTEDPQRSFWGWNVDACHAEQANDVLVLDDVIVWSEFKRLATESYVNIREARDIFAWDSICSTEGIARSVRSGGSKDDAEDSLTFRGLQRKRFCANHGGDPLYFSSGASQNRGARVEHDTVRGGCIRADGK